MQKKNVLNLIRCYAEKNDEGFRRESYAIANYFDSIGDSELAQYIMALLSGVNTFSPQAIEGEHSFFTKIDLDSSPLEIPAVIEDNVRGIINASNNNVSVSKFLFEGAPGTGKTEIVKRIARALDRDLYAVNFDNLVDSKLGQTTKNIATVFAEIKNFSQTDKVVILFDEIDAIALDRVNSNDSREMGRVTSSVLKGLDGLVNNITLIATTNLYEQFDQALIRRFDLVVNFNQYSREDLIKVAESILNELLPKFKLAGRNMRLFRKIISSAEELPQPGQLKNIIKTSLAFSDHQDEYDYLKRLYKSTQLSENSLDLKVLKGHNFTIREMAILNGVSKSQIYREIST